MRLAVIPARGGSKRIPRKNIKKFCGKPIIAWSIEAALQSEIFDRVIVSTDDEEIAAVAKAFGADVPFIRPARLSDDFSGTDLVMKHAVEWFSHSKQVGLDKVCCIYSTAPFIQKRFLKESLRLLECSNKDFVFSSTTFAFPVQRGFFVNDSEEIEPLFKECIDSRSQDLKEIYHDAGQFYWGTPEAFLNERDIFSKYSSPYLLPRYYVQDIDTLEDWQHAELMFQALNSQAF